MKKNKNHYTETDFLLDMYGLGTVDEPRFVLADESPEAIRVFRAAQLDLLEEMIECDDRE